MPMTLSCVLAWRYDLGYFTHLLTYVSQILSIDGQQTSTMSYDEILKDLNSKLSTEVGQCMHACIEKVEYMTMSIVSACCPLRSRGL